MRRACAVWLVALASAMGCNDNIVPYQPIGSDDLPGSGGFLAATGGSIGAGGSPVLGGLQCSSFFGGGVTNQKPWQYAQYVWLSEDDASKIRAAESPFRAAISLPSADEIGAFFASPTDLNLGDTGHALFRLVGERFRHPLLGWPAPWVTHADPTAPPNATHLLRLEYADDAILLTFDGSTFTAIDQQNYYVDLAVALSQPERIAGVYMPMGSTLGVPATCGDIYGVPTIASRIFLLAESAAVKGWSVQAATGQPRFEADLSSLEQFFSVVRAQAGDQLGPASEAPYYWCNVIGSDCRSGYLGTLANPSSRYDISVASLARLIDELKALPASDLAFSSSDFEHGGGGAGGESPVVPELGGASP